MYSSESTRTQHWSFIASLKSSIDTVLASTSQPVTPTHGFMRTLKKRGVLKRVYTQNIDGFEASAGLEAVGIEGVRETSVIGIGADKGKGKGKAKQWEGDFVQLHGSAHRVRCSACEWVGVWEEEHGEAFAVGETVDCPACEERGKSLPCWWGFYRA